jgi:hypothetical protein
VLCVEEGWAVRGSFRFGFVSEVGPEGAPLMGRAVKSTGSRVISGCIWIVRAKFGKKLYSSKIAFMIRNAFCRRSIGKDLSKLLANPRFS